MLDVRVLSGCRVDYIQERLQIVACHQSTIIIYNHNDLSLWPKIYASWHIVKSNLCDIIEFLVTVTQTALASVMDPS